MSSAAPQTLCSCGDPAVGIHDGEPQCSECLAILTEDDAPETFWRIQDAGLQLSRSHRSRTWNVNDDDDEGEEHAGTSVVRGCGSLPSAQASVHMGAVDIVELEGEEIELGWDGEPVVLPTRELRRFRLSEELFRANGWRLPLPRECTPEALVAAGWAEVETMDVAE